MTVLLLLGIIEDTFLKYCVDSWSVQLIQVKHWFV